MLSLNIALFLTAFTTLMLELTLIRVFDVIWVPNMSYMVVTCTMFCFGAAGVYASLRKQEKQERVEIKLASYALGFGVLAIAILPLLNSLPIRFKHLVDRPVTSMLLFLAMYLILAVPFFLSGRIFSLVFNRYASQIQKLYFWDLSGAALGCVIMIPLLPLIGPGGLLFIACALCLVAAGLFSRKRAFLIGALCLAMIVGAVPFFKKSGYFEFKEHLSKRSLETFKKQGKIERTYWDPISKIDVVSEYPRAHRVHDRKKFIAYDGGSQSSYIYRFDGDYEKLRSGLPKQANKHFWARIVLASHWLKQDTDQTVLVIGSAGGQETKAALVYGAKRVDAVELVKYVVDIGKGAYARFNGGIFNHPNVRAIAGEGRSFLRTSKEQYDIIQIFSNHTSSSIAAGTGAMATNYLQTAEAYREYFEHLKADGILHINHHIYPKMITTAALAWKKMGRDEFEKHVVVFVAPNVTDTLPTTLIKMTPWSKAEVAKLQQFFQRNRQMVENPFDRENSYLSSEFFSGEFSKATAQKIPYRILPSTDNKPYFNFLRKSLNMMQPNSDQYVTQGVAGVMNSQMAGWVAKDVIHLIITAVVSILFTVIFIIVPLFFSGAGKTPWAAKTTSLAYFSLLGCGFILFELVFIQIFMKLIGYPLYTYSVVVFAILLAAGTGSLVSSKIGISVQKKWYIPFIGILISGFLLTVSYTYVFKVFLASPTLIRIFVAAVMIFPLGFFLGMPFPLGIMALENKPHGAIPWAWGMNGLFTVIGGLLSISLSIYVGFNLTLLFTLLIYLLAFLLFAQIRKHLV